MDIGSIATGLSTLTSAASSLPLISSLGNKASQSSNSQPTQGPTAQARAILAQYDVHQISPRQVSELVQKLQDSGVLAPQDSQDLTQLRSQLDAQGVPSDQAVDLPSFLQQQIANQTLALQQMADPSSTEHAAAQAKLSLLSRQLAWVQKFTAVQDAPDGIQAVA